MQSTAAALNWGTRLAWNGKWRIAENTRVRQIPLRASVLGCSTMVFHIINRFTASRSIFSNRCFIFGFIKVKSQCNSREIFPLACHFCFQFFSSQHWLFYLTCFVVSDVNITCNLYLLIFSLKNWNFKFKYWFYRTYSETEWGLKQL